MIKHHVYYVYLQKPFPSSLPIGSMYGIYANIGGILMGSMLPYIAYMDPMGYKQNIKLPMLQSSVPPPPPVPSGPAPATGGSAGVPEATGAAKLQRFQRNDARAANRGETGRWNHGVGGETGRETWDLPGRKWMTYGEMDVGWVGILSMSKLWGWAWWLMLELAVSGSCWRRKSWWFKECRMWWLNVIETCLQVLQTQSSSILHFPSWKQG